MRVSTLCVIGAGGAGLCAIKHGIDHGLQVTAFEQAKEIGGTWVFTSDYGNDIHSSMYKGLHTNLPKEVMQYPDLPFAEQERSYIPAEDVLAYYRWYANKFDLCRHVKFEHNVVRVRPMLDGSWEVLVKKDLPEGSEYITLCFDAVLVCNGHYSTPAMPKYEGSEAFKGKQLHSHDYKCADPFKDQQVLGKLFVIQLDSQFIFVP